MFQDKEHNNYFKLTLAEDGGKRFLRKKELEENHPILHVIPVIWKALKFFAYSNSIYILFSESSKNYNLQPYAVKSPYQLS